MSCLPCLSVCRCTCAETLGVCACACGQDLKAEARQNAREEERDRRIAEAIDEADEQERQRLSAMNEAPSLAFARALQADWDAEQAAKAAEVSERARVFVGREAPRPTAPCSNPRVMPRG